MNEWKKLKLSEIASVNESSVSKNFHFKNIEYIDTSSVTENVFDLPQFLNLNDAPSRAKRLVKNGDTIISTVRPIQKHFGFISNCKPNTVLSTGFAVVSPKKVDPRFLYYFLTQDEITQYLNTIAESGTTTFPAFRADELNDLEILLPDSIEKQKAIAEILSSLDDKIELNNQINQNLEALAQALFKQWFVDFEFPNENGEPYKSSGGEMVDSELGEIPKGWVISVLSDIIEFNPTEKLSKGAISSYLDMSSLPTIGSFPELPIKREFSSGMKFKNGDTLLARITPCLENGKTAYIQFLNENEVAWGSTEFIVLRSKASWPKEVSYLIARDENFRNFAIQNLVGTSGRQRVSSSILMNYPVIIPSDKSILGSFGRIVSDLFEKIKANSFENIYLTQLRDTLLPKLISGELEVNESLLEQTF